MLQIGAAVVVHVHTAIGMLVQIATQHCVLFNGWQIVARLIASSMCVYGFFGVVNCHSMFAECVQEAILVVKVCSGSIHDNTTVRNIDDVAMYGLHSVQHLGYRLAGLLKLLGITELAEVILMTLG